VGDLVLRIVGRRPSTRVKELGRLPGVIVVGEVEDIRPEMSRADLVIAPLRTARGLQNKVLEAMAARKPVIASPAALEGIGCRSGADAICADDPQQWEDAIQWLVSSQALRCEIGRNGRRYVEANHDWSRCLAPLANLLELPADEPA